MNFRSGWLNNFPNDTCGMCGTHKSVKWEHLGHNFCNRCILAVGESENEFELFARINKYKEVKK